MPVTMPLLKRLRYCLLSTLLLLVSEVFFAPTAGAQTTCSPIMGLGSVQFLDNNGKPLTSGVLYSFVAGSTNQQATFTDSTCLVQNVNPITFSSGARINIWLTTSLFYKFVLCLQNDGAFCAPADVLFSVDNVPGGSTGSGGGGGSTFTGTFISGSANPATSGILRLAATDQICWRNAAGTANVCMAKDTSDVWSWGLNTIKLPVGACSATGAGFVYLCADSTANRLKESDIGGSYIQLVHPGVDINTSDQVTQVHFGAAAIPFSGTVPTTNQFLRWNGTNIVGAPPEAVLQFCSACTLSNGLVFSEGVNGALGNETVFAVSHTIVRFTYNVTLTATGCATSPVIGVRDVTSSTNLYTVTIANGASVAFVDSGVLSVGTTAGDKIVVGILTAASGCSVAPQLSSVEMVYQ